MSEGFIRIVGAKEHNLKNISLNIPRDKLVVITGLSGSGKSSLAFDTIYAEGQRRYVESLSAYARQFLEQLEKPDVEHIEGMSPAISIEQRSAGSNPRSTVATTTEVYDYLRLLFARIGTPYCHKCGQKIVRQTQDEILDRILQYPDGTKLLVLAPVIRGRKGEYNNLFEELKKQGFVRARVDGSIFSLEKKIKIDKNKKHTIEVVVDRLVIEKDARDRLADSIEIALKVGKGLVLASKDFPDDSTFPKVVLPKAEEVLFSELYSCPKCGVSYEEIEPRIFSFNSPYGACQACGGLGTKVGIDIDLVIPDKAKPLKQAIKPWRVGGMRIILYYRRRLRKFAHEYGFELETPFDQIPDDARDVIINGSKPDGQPYFEGIIPNLLRRLKETDSEFMRREINKYTSETVCPACQGRRLRPESLSIKIGDRSISNVAALSIKEAREFFLSLRLTEKQEKIAHQILKEIKERLNFMANVGLDYLTLDRQSSTLSGGEAQRIRLATQIGAGLVGVVYILDEP
ncbi:MAG: excinuclease ABC subunit UvrA, partial [Candidatus Omnitrophica bacterium]|nr:excinuclease ABC subunit UvrA [Candidatus Omnitrophota bacterium]